VRLQNITYSQVITGNYDRSAESTSHPPCCWAPPRPGVEAPTARDLGLVRLEADSYLALCMLRLPDNLGGFAFQSMSVAWL